MKRLITVLTLLLALSAFLTYAQENTGTVLGKVTLAEDGSPLPGVTVTLTGTAYGKNTFVSTKEGTFRFARLFPGTYSLHFELQGFKPQDRTSFRVSINANVEMNVAMEPGGLQEEVTVIAQTQMLDTRKAQVSSNYTSEQITSLPSPCAPRKSSTWRLAS